MNSATRWRTAALLVMTLVLGSSPVAATEPRPGTVPPSQAPTDGAPPPSATSPSEGDADDPLCAPLLLDGNYGFGTHVVMRRLPTAADLNDLTAVQGFRQLLIALPQWPAGYAELRPLQQHVMPDGGEVVVLLPGWPPTREALAAWNMVGGNLRLIMVVGGPPADRALITELNRLRPLERVIAQMEYPSRSGFERLQRPLSFRVLKH